MGVEDSVFAVFEVIVIDVELPFESAVGHATTSVQQVDDLIEYLVNIHPTSSPPFSLQLTPRR
jgi:hypothetical protein